MFARSGPAHEKKRIFQITEIHYDTYRRLEALVSCSSLCKMLLDKRPRAEDFDACVTTRLMEMLIATDDQLTARSYGTGKKHVVRRILADGFVECRSYNEIPMDRDQCQDWPDFHSWKLAA